MSLISTVVSFVPFDITEWKPGLFPGRFNIKASDMKTPQLLQVGTCNHFVYLDESRGNLPVRNPSDIVANSIVNDYKEGQLGIEETALPALFWVPREITVEEVLENKINVARVLIHQKQWMTNIAMIADDDWRKYQKHNVISDFQRKAALLIGWTSVNHAWLGPMMTMSSKACPSCGLSYSEGLAICPSCRCILDQKKYDQLQFA